MAGPGIIGTEFRHLDATWHDDADKYLRDAVRAVTSRGGFALSSLGPYTSGVTADVRYSQYSFDTSGGGFTFTLLPSASWGPNKSGYIRIVLLNGTNNLTVAAATGDVINGAASITINTPGEIWELWSDGGTSWYARPEASTVVQSYTPTITAGAGTFTSVSAGGIYVKIGPLYYFKIGIGITTNGTAATDVRASLPVTPTDYASWPVTEVSSTFFTGSAQVTNGSATLILRKYDGTYPGGSGLTLITSGWLKV